MLVTNNQMSDQGIQTDVTFVQKSQAAVNEAKPLDDKKIGFEVYFTYSYSQRRETKIEASSLWNQRK